MRKIGLLMVLIILITPLLKANNLTLGTPTINGSSISLTIKWDNSWYVNTGPSNWDAVWIFVKRQTCNQANQNPWIHADLSLGSITGSTLQVDVAADKKGAFVRRSTAGIGNITEETLTITLESAIGADNIGVYGIEMVNVPQGEFYIGDGRSSLNGFTNGNSENPLLINADKQTSGLGAKEIYQKTGLGSSGPLPTSFPLGFNQFYCMKYEITTAQYVSFLNSLTFNQQLRLHDDQNVNSPTSPIGTAVNKQFGYSIEIKTPGISTTSITPAVYGNDATDDNNFDQSNDGLGLPVAIRLKNFLAFLDWAALRPMTEFEFEKACRGPLIPVLGEYAWGTTDLAPINIGSRTNRLLPNEIINTTPFGPVNVGGQFWRVGITATSSSDRVRAAATYFGIMDMTGNANERCIGGWNWDYSAFTTINGDGNIDSDGFANVANWPLIKGLDLNAIERFLARRGGSTNGADARAVSSRVYSNLSDANYTYATGGRGVRSF